MDIELKWTTSFLNESSLRKLFRVTLRQKENEFAKATLLIDAETPLPPQGTEGLLREGNHTIFKGQLVGVPTKIEGPFAEIELIAKPKKFSEQLNDLTQDCRKPPYWDELWIPPEKREHFEERQDVRTAAFYCDRKTGDLSLSDWFEGRETLPVDTKFFSDSLKLHLKKERLNSVTLHVEAKWIQTLEGTSNVASALRRAFPHAKISTYGKEALLNRWPTPSHSLGKSGLRIIKSDLKEVTPLSKRMPRFSPQVLLKKDAAPLKPFRVRRHWFKPTLWVAWVMKQKRKETLTLTLHHHFQPLYPGEGQHKILTHSLQNLLPSDTPFPWSPNKFYKKGDTLISHAQLYEALEDHLSGMIFHEDKEKWTPLKKIDSALESESRGSFFMTERGYRAADHALERAKFELAKSARSLEIHFEGPWEGLRDLTTDMTVRLKDPRLPGGEILGKVIDYTLLADGHSGDRKGKVTLLCAPGAKVPKKDPRPSAPLYVEEGYCEDPYQVYEGGHRETPSGLVYARYDDQTVPKILPPHDLVRHVEVTNGPEDQEREIINCSPNTVESLRKRLSSQATRIRVYFRDLRTKERLDHNIILTPQDPWSATQQVTL